MTNQNMLVELTERLVNLMSEVGRAVHALDSILTDKSIPLDVRWTAYCDLVEAGVIRSIESYGDGYVETLREGISLFSDFHMDRCQTITYPEFLNYRIIDNDFQVSNENLSEWQEKVLASGYAGFTYDW